MTVKTSLSERVAGAEGQHLLLSASVMGISRTLSCVKGRRGESACGLL